MCVDVATNVASVRSLNSSAVVYLLQWEPRRNRLLQIQVCFCFCCCCCCCSQMAFNAMSAFNGLCQVILNFMTIFFLFVVVVAFLCYNVVVAVIAFKLQYCCCYCCCFFTFVAIAAAARIWNCYWSVWIKCNNSYVATTTTTISLNAIALATGC